MEQQIHLDKHFKAKRHKHITKQQKNIVKSYPRAAVDTDAMLCPGGGEGSYSYWVTIFSYFQRIQLTELSLSTKELRQPENPDK